MLTRRSLLKRLGAAVVAAPALAITATGTAEAAPISEEEQARDSGARVLARPTPLQLEYERLKRICTGDGCQLFGGFVSDQLSWTYVHRRPGVSYEPWPVFIERTDALGAAYLLEWWRGQHGIA